MEEVIKYLRDVMGVETKSALLTAKELVKLPLFLKRGFDLFRGSIIDQNIIWAKPKDKEEITPEQIKKQSQQLENILGYPIVFILNEIDSWERKRFIEKRVSFVEPNKNLFLPNLLIHFKDSNRRIENKNESKARHLSPKVQYVLLYHLQIGSLENIPFKNIAKQIGFSTMDVSRITKELEQYKLIKIEIGKEKTIQFNLQGKELWLKVLPLLKSPVKETWFTDQDIIDDKFKIGGDTALSSYTMLAESKLKTFVIGKDQYRSMRLLGDLSNLDKKRGKNRIEVWSYSPSILSSINTVDKLSLFLTLQLEQDERVIGALDELIKEIQW